MGRKKYEDVEIGDVYGRWTVVGKGKFEKSIQYLICKCSCGNVKPKEISCYDLLRGHSKSCGCIKREIMQNRTSSRKTFYSWCIENDRNDLLYSWDYNLNNISPLDISFKSNKKLYFKCTNNINHNSKSMMINNLVANNGTIECVECHSFKNWCIENEEFDVLNRWDYDLNKCNPNEVFRGTGKKYYFKCPKGLHKSELKSLNNFTNNSSRQIGSMNCNQCNSFAQYLIDLYGNNALDKFWDYEKNNIDPYTIPYSWNKKVWVRCQEKDYHGSYSILCNNFTKGERCPFCSGKKVNYLDSFGHIFSEMLDIWSNKNTKSPYEYSLYGAKKVWWKCKDNKHCEYNRTIYNSIICNFRCPNCSRERSESMLQEKVRLYLQSLEYKIYHENECSIIPINPKTNCKLPFDNEINELKLIIEVNGQQHYEVCSFHYLISRRDNITPEQSLKRRKLYDRYKKAVAECNGYFYLEIPYWTENDESYKTLIDNKINEIIHKTKEST